MNFATNFKIQKHMKYNVSMKFNGNLKFVSKIIVVLVSDQPLAIFQPILVHMIWLNRGVRSKDEVLEAVTERDLKSQVTYFSDFLP